MAYNIPYFRTTLPSATSLVAYWRKYGSDATSPDDPAGHSRWFGTPASTRTDVTKSWEWWFAGSFSVPSAHANVSNGFTFFDNHNSSYDVGNTGSGGIGWGFGTDVSAVRFEFRPSLNQWRLYHEPNFPNHRFDIATISRDTRYDFVVQLILGRLDQELGLAGPGVAGGGIGNHPNNGYGRTRVWVNGSDAPFDTGNISTLQRAQNPGNGVTYTQTLIVGPWDGWYTGNLSTSVSADQSATRIGRSVGEALLDGSVGGFPILAYYDGSEGPIGTAVDLSPISSSSFLAPPSLTGGPPPEVPPTPTSNIGPFNQPVQWNASTGVTDPPPDIPPTVVENHIGDWSDQVQWNAYAGMVPAEDGSITLTGTFEGTLTFTPHSHGGTTLFTPNP